MKARQESGQLSVSVTVLGTERASEEKIKIRPFVTTPAKVRVSGGVTINMGNYESARVDVSMEVPCYKEEMLRVYQELKRVVEQLVKARVDEIVNQDEGQL